MEKNINMCSETNINFLNTNSITYSQKKYLDKKCLNNKRNYGIDLLRIFSMINIIILHINLFCKELNFNYRYPKFKSVWLLEIMAYWAVDGFGLISGIVGYKKYKFSNLTYIWIQSSFYSSIPSIDLYLRKKCSLKRLITSFFPILIKFRWYINAYFCMYLFLPFINYGINNINLKTYRNLIYFFVLFFSVYTIISSIIIKKSIFHFLNGGYTAMWLII